MREIGPRPGGAHPDPTHFDRIRRLAIEREQGACAGCYEKGHPLEAHHRTYERWGREEPGDIYMFCHECHDLFTSAQWKIRALRREPLPPPLALGLEVERPSAAAVEPIGAPTLASPIVEHAPAASIAAVTLPAPVVRRAFPARAEGRHALHGEEETS